MTSIINVVYHITVGENNGISECIFFAYTKIIRIIIMERKNDNNVHEVIIVCSSAGVSS